MLFLCIRTQNVGLTIYHRRQLGTRIHKECAHFNNGFCTLNSIPVNPEQPACLRFTPKNVTVAAPGVKPYIQPPQITPLYPQPIRTPHIRYPQTQIPQFRRPVYAMNSRGAGAAGGGRGGKGRGTGRKGGFAAGPGGSCVCPKCGYTTPHTLGSPCYQQSCRRCGTPMTRQR